MILAEMAASRLQEAVKSFVWLLFKSKVESLKEKCHWSSTYSLTSSTLHRWLYSFRNHDGD